MCGRTVIHTEGPGGAEGAPTQPVTGKQGAGTTTENSRTRLTHREVCGGQRPGCQRSSSRGPGVRSLPLALSVFLRMYITSGDKGPRPRATASPGCPGDSMAAPRLPTYSPGYVWCGQQCLCAVLRVSSPPGPPGQGHLIITVPTTGLSVRKGASTGPTTAHPPGCQPCSCPVASYRLPPHFMFPSATPTPRHR